MGLQGVQWIRGLIVVRVNWPGHLGLKKKKIANQVTWTAVMAQSREPKRGRTEVHSLSPRK